jgi:patatin-like phospholipase/acyl hydrolase
MSSQYIRLLSLDGGGFRGIITLQILQCVMERIQQAQGLANTPKPCQYFDLMVGTSTGGLIALLLGRYGMSVQDALQAYLSLGAELFGHAHGSFVRYFITGRPQFDSAPLRAWVSSHEDATLVDSSAPCRVSTDAFDL